MSNASRGTSNVREFGQRLKDTRHRHSLSQPQLAVILGVSVAALSRWEHGNRNPRAKHFKKISHWQQQVATIGEASRKIEVTEQTDYRWRKEYGGIQLEQAKRLKELEQENSRLKKLVADVSLD